MQTVKIKIMNDYYNENPDLIPAHGREGDAGLDLRSMSHYTILPGCRVKIPLGFGIEIPDGHFGRIEGRSGNAVKFGIDTIGNIIDCNYRGEISAMLVNTGSEAFKIEQGDRVAQLIIQQYLPCQLHIAHELNSSDRGESGFGSSGNK